MNLKKFWHRLVAVMTLTVCLVTLQVPLFSNQAWAATQCPEKAVMSNVNCSDSSTTINTTDRFTTINIYNNDSGGKVKAFTEGVVAGSIVGIGAAGITYQALQSLHPDKSKEGVADFQYESRAKSLKN